MDMKDIKNLDKEQVLGLFGLQEADSILASGLRALGLIGLGAAIGATVMLFLAPQSGREMRENVVKRVKNTTDHVAAAARSKIDEVQATRT